MAEPRRVAFVGTGQVVRFWIGPLLARPDVRVVAVVEADAARGRAFVEAHGLGCPVLATVEEAIAVAGADLVVNATPPEHHRPISEAALELGADVFTEKPLAATLEDAAALVAAAARTGRTLIVMQNRRYHPAIRAMRDAIASGAIGDPVLANACMWMAPHFPMRFVHEMEHPVLVDVSVHTFDQARLLTGRDAVAVHCIERHPGYSWFAGHALAAGTFELEDGVVFAYQGSYVTPGFRASWDSDWRIGGPRGTLRWDGEGTPEAEVVTGEPRGDALWEPTARRPLEAPAPRDATGHAAAIDDALDALAEGRTPPTTAADNLKSLAMSFAALRSAAEGRIVRIDEVI